jgi:hypothetical protein
MARVGTRAAAGNPRPRAAGRTQGGARGLLRAPPVARQSAIFSEATWMTSPFCSPVTFTRT